MNYFDLVQHYQSPSGGSLALSNSSWMLWVNKQFALGSEVASGRPGW
jgi:hypothetical protein